MKTYSSKDFYLSSFLIANDGELIDTLINDGVTTFVFEMNEGVKRLLAATIHSSLEWNLWRMVRPYVL